MRYILIILIAIPFVGVGQSNEYTLEAKDFMWKVVRPNHSDTFMILNTKADTIPSSILISNKAPSFGHAIDGYCIYKYGQCTGKHLRYWHKKWINIGPQYIIWKCIKREYK